MCRRSLAESTTTAADSGATQEASGPTTSPGDEELLTQIRAHMEELYSQGAVAYVDHEGDFRGFGEPLYTPAAGYDDDRSEFAGMYS